MSDDEVIADMSSGDRLSKLLFEHEGHTLRNIKFCRGGRDVVTAGELRSVIHSAILAKRTGRIQGHASFADVSRAPVEAYELVKNL